jgi:hypothetical protein
MKDFIYCDEVSTITLEQWEYWKERVKMRKQNECPLNHSALQEECIRKGISFIRCPNCDKVIVGEPRTTAGSLD